MHPTYTPAAANAASQVGGHLSLACAHCCVWSNMRPSEPAQPFQSPLQSRATQRPPTCLGAKEWPSGGLAVQQGGMSLLQQQALLGVGGEALRL